MHEVSFADALAAAWADLHVDEALATLYPDRDWGDRTLITVTVSGAAKDLVARGVLDVAEAASLPTGRTVTYRSRKVRMSASGRIRVILEAWNPPGFRSQQRKRENAQAMIDLLAAALAPDPWRPSVQQRK